jgi:hypothetical protein
LYKSKLLNTQHHVSDKDHLFVNLVKNVCKAAKTITFAQFMSKLTDYRKLLGANKTTELSELKTIYRNLMKEWHPDKFQESDEKKHEAEAKSKEFIEAYNFLASVAPETIAKALPEYTETISASTILDFSYTKTTLTLTFQDSSSYEYFDVPKAIYIKLINSDSPGRFCRRHIYHEFVYRKVAKAVEA